MEKMLTGENLLMGCHGFCQRRTKNVGARMAKLVYSLSKLITLFLLGFIPILGQSIVPILTFIFTVWMMAIQYCDYPFDNHKILSAVKTELAENVL